jgi:hypothetical protein
MKFTLKRGDTIVQMIGDQPHGYHAIVLELVDTIPDEHQLFKHQGKPGYLIYYLYSGIMHNDSLNKEQVANFMKDFRACQDRGLNWITEESVQQCYFQKIAYEA